MSLANVPAMSVDVNRVWYLPGCVFQVNAPAHSSHQCSRALVFHSETNHFMTLNPVSFSYFFHLTLSDKWSPGLGAQALS